MEALIIRRTFDAPRELVWRAWTEPELMKKWWGPKEFTVPACEIELREGGSFLYCMRSQEGKDFWGTGTYREINPPKRIVVTDSFADPEGNVVPATYYGMSPGLPKELLLTVTLEQDGEKTQLILGHEGMPSGKDSDDARDGWNQSLDKLEDLLKSMRQEEEAAA